MTTLDRHHRPDHDSPDAATAARPSTSAHETRCERRLRLVLRLNATSSALAGLVMAVAPDAIDDLLDTGRPGWIRVVGLALLPFAAFVAWLSTASLPRLRAEVPFVIAGDVGWVVASIATVLLGWYSGAGVVAVLAMAVVVDVWALLQWTAWRHLPRD